MFKTSAYRIPVRAQVSTEKHIQHHNQQKAKKKEVKRASHKTESSPHLSPTLHPGKGVRSSHIVSKPNEKRTPKRKAKKKNYLKIGRNHQLQKDSLPCKTERNTSLFYFTTLLSLSTNNYTCVCVFFSVERDPYFLISAVRSASLASTKYLNHIRKQTIGKRMRKATCYQFLQPYIS